MSNAFGTLFRFTVFGQSHSPVVGVTVEGLPYGFEPDIGTLRAFMARRAPGGALSSPRREQDEPEIVSGLFGGRCCGAPLTVIIKNSDARPEDYDGLRAVPRPGHADYAAAVKYGLQNRDYSGGGQFSGRLTAPLCAAGGLCIQVFKRLGVEIKAEIASVAGLTDPDEMRRAIEEARDSGNSVGGVTACTVTGFPAGVGEPMFGGLENRISAAVFAIPAVKGIEFGSGFAGTALRGSENNDAFFSRCGRVSTSTNNHGGILGGISTGMPIVFRAAFKPTPSIALPQSSVNLETLEETELVIRGRHDPCIVPRTLPCVEAAAAVALYDALLESRALGEART